MIGTVLRQSALEMWDHCPALFAANIVLIGAGLGAYLAAVETARLGLGFAVTALVVAAFAAVWLFGLTAHLIDAFLDHRAIDRPLMGRAARRSVSPAVVWTATTLCLGAVAWRLVGETFAISDAAGIAATVLLLWIAVLWLQASLFFFPLLALKGSDVPAAVNATLLVVLGNPAFCLAVTFIAATFFLLGVFILPGPAGALVLLRNAARMRLRRYASTTAPDEPPDWDRLLAGERDRTARRSLRSVIFPWKP